VRLVLSDDGSKDATIAIARAHFPADRLTCLGDGINRGPGQAFQTGFTHILANAQDGDRIVTLEADCTSDITILPEMLAIADLGYDLVLASVYAQGGGFDKTTFFRRLLSSVANMFFRFAFDLRVATLSSFYRVYSVRRLRKAQQQHGALIREAGFICMLEILVKMIDSGARVIEVPMVLHSSKRVGASRMKMFRTSMAYFRFLMTYRGERKRNMARPSAA
jgi:dolichol-phosphate mannosyltransferase